MSRRVLVALAVALLLVVAGCNAPAAGDGPTATGTPTERAGDFAAGPGTDSPTATPTPSPTDTPTVRPWSKVTVEEGNFSFDAAAVYQRVVRMHGLTLAEAPNVTVYVRDTSSVALTRIYRPSGFEEAMGIRPAAGKTAIAGLASGTRVTVYEGVVTTPAGRESVLAHEYAHVVQSLQQGHSRVARNVEPGTNNEGRVEGGIIEGAATYVQYRYEARYQARSSRPDSWAERRAGRTAFGAFLVAPYYFGERYVAQRVDGVDELAAVYDDPPQTTEQLVHGYAPDEEPPRALTVDEDLDGGWERARDGARPAERTKGELFVRLVLERQLALDRAADAAAGWGADRVVTYEAGDGDRGHAWVLRWDDAAEADEFAAALRDYLDARGDRAGQGWVAGGDAYRVVRPDDETVALLTGDDGFVDAASVAGDDGRYTVAVGGEG